MTKSLTSNKIIECHVRVCTAAVARDTHELCAFAVDRCCTHASRVPSQYPCVYESHFHGTQQYFGTHPQNTYTQFIDNARNHIGCKCIHRMQQHQQQSIEKTRALIVQCKCIQHIVIYVLDRPVYRHAISSCTFTILIEVSKGSGKSGYLFFNSCAILFVPETRMCTHARNPMPEIIKLYKQCIVAYLVS